MAATLPKERATVASWLIRAGLALLWLLVAPVSIMALLFLAFWLALPGDEAWRYWAIAAGAFGFVAVPVAAVMGPSFASRYPKVAGYLLTLVATLIFLIVFQAQPESKAALIISLWVGTSGILLLVGSFYKRPFVGGP